MPGPTLTFAFIIATLLGAGFHFVVGGDIRRLAMFLLAGWVGFALGHMLGVLFEINILNIGTLRVVPAAAGALVALIAAFVLTADRAQRFAQR